MKRDVIVVTAAYGQQQVAALGGQQALLPIIAAAGADGVEIRRELFTPQQLKQLPQLAQAIAAAQLAAFYSVPEALFMPDGSLNPRLDLHFAEAQQLNARMLKYALGHFQPGFDGGKLRSRLVGKTVQLVVENDQTDCGRLTALQRFFQADEASRIISGMTFDMANWLWVGDRPIDAAGSLSRHVDYIHVKAAAPQGSGWRAVALDQADSLWRETLALLPGDVPRAIEFPLEGRDLVATTRHYVDLLREV
ncbi:sugar phosphate isomerase/epimerase [Erwinia amylovora]|uniref:sugar phosphate isomerase/epimerase n=1 Tax=Erwinia amylovora TaxID=552 RepID=UPI001443DC92|nr:sugar phosphate isomerase/epimerase [Erwinia amylovora]